MAKGYTTEEKIEKYILHSIDPTYSTQLTEWIEAVEKHIDQVTGRNFKAEEEASERVYDGDGSPTLLIDDCVEIEAVSVGGDSYGGSFTEVEETGPDRYFTYPANHAELGLPIRKIVLNSQCFMEGRQNHKVEARWGYSETPPADIIFAATVLVSGILNQQRGGGDKVVQERIGNYTVSYSTDDTDAVSDFKRTLQILDSYRILHI